MNKLFICALPFLLSVGCAATAATEDAPQTQLETMTEQRASVSDVQAKLDVFTHALFDRDVEALEGVVSSEVVTQGEQRGIPLAEFLAKQRNALVNTFRLADGDRPSIEVAAVVEEGDDIRATLKLRGEELKKPFHLVRENGELKINVAPPGFSKASPDGVMFGSSSYQVKNEMIAGNANLVLGCYAGKLSNGQHKPYTQVSVPAKSTRSVTCADACGWWAGTFFTDGASTKHCDWNAWGADVILGVYGGTWVCADNC